MAGVARVVHERDNEEVREARCCARRSRSSRPPIGYERASLTALRLSRDTAQPYADRPERALLADFRSS
jgi:hypothetical protein